MVPFVSRKCHWAPLKPSPLRVVWSMEEEKEEIPISSAPLETEVSNGAERVEEEVEPLFPTYLCFRMLRLMSMSMRERICVGSDELPA